MSTRNSSSKSGATKSTSSESSTDAPATDVAGDVVATPAASAAAPFMSNKDADALLASLTDEAAVSALVRNLDVRAEAALAEYKRLQAAKARLTGVPTETEEAPEPRRRGPRKQATATPKAKTGNDDAGGHTDHADWIDKAIGDGDMQKAEIGQRLEALKHPMDPGTLSTYLSIMTKRGQLIPTAHTPRRYSYKRNKKYVAG